VEDDKVDEEEVEEDMEEEVEEEELEIMGEEVEGIDRDGLFLDIRLPLLRSSWGRRYESGGVGGDSSTKTTGVLDLVTIGLGRFGEMGGIEEETDVGEVEESEEMKAEDEEEEGELTSTRVKEEKLVGESVSVTLDRPLPLESSEGDRARFESK
jgi:hypothetical protein